MIFDGEQTRVTRSVGKLVNLHEELKVRPYPDDSALVHALGHPRSSAKRMLTLTTSPVTVAQWDRRKPSRIKSESEAQGHVFTSKTDTEIFSHCVREKIDEGIDLTTAVRSILKELKAAMPSR